MKHITIMILTILFLFNLSLSVNAKNSALEGPPSTIKLKVAPPKNFDEALKRVADFLILDSILPPVINRDNVKQQLFGNYKKDIESYISKNNIDLQNLSKIIQEKLNNKKEKLEKIKKDVYNILIEKKAKKNKQNNLIKKQETKANNYYIFLVVIIIFLIIGTFFYFRKK